MHYSQHDLIEIYPACWTTIVVQQVVPGQFETLNTYKTTSSLLLP
ncbi:protein of unknown function [Candidatus Nitrosocosmicus franklandus]|uniref:Uncharacterized protein n=1 Tax=Candidatus Nitrosocosmicus franklandianus TaxID=1798806 RepID=A0A484I9K3_9ARCH|nr:protein of unknown function [Candidatus Nitrosocosmicus franklandus]